MKKTNKAPVKSSPTLSLSADAQGHIRAEAVRFLEFTGGVISDDDALENIIHEHALLQRLINAGAAECAPHVVNVGSMAYSMESDSIRLIDAIEDTALVKFKADVLAVLQDPTALQSVQALHSRIGLLGIANGWWVKSENTTGPQLAPATPPVPF